MNTVVEKGLGFYRQALEAGLTRGEAKEFAYSEVPELCEILSDRAVLTHWSNGIKAVYKELNASKSSDPAPKTIVRSASDNGQDNNNRRDAIVHTSSGRINVTDSFVAVLSQLSPKIGDVLCLGDLEFWSRLLGVTPTGVTMPFRNYPHRQTTAIEKSGWLFEIVNSSFRSFAVRVIAAPAPPEAPAPGGLTPDELATLRELLKKIG